MTNPVVTHTAEGLADAADLLKRLALLLPSGRLALGILGAAELTQTVAALMKSNGLTIEQVLAQITPVDPIVLPWEQDNPKL